MIDPPVPNTLRGDKNKLERRRLEKKIVRTMRKSNMKISQLGKILEELLRAKQIMTQYETEHKNSGEKLERY